MTFASYYAIRVSAEAHFCLSMVTQAMSVNPATITKRYRKLVFWAWFITFDLIMFGAFVRLTDSGLGCPDWPGCYGNFSPIGASEHIRDALSSMPYGPVSFPKAWIEMVHRYVGSILGLLKISFTLMAWRGGHILQ